MARREWTVLLITDERSGVRQYQLTRNLLRYVIAGLVCFAVLISLLTVLAVDVSAPLREMHVVRENAELRTQLLGVRSEVSQLNTTLNNLWRSDEQFRLVAGLEPLDDAVRKAGIGGPDESTLEHDRLWRLDPATGARVFGSRMEVAALLRRARLLSASWAEAHDSLTTKQTRLEATPSITPAPGFISSAFSEFRWHPLLDRPRPHQGLDIAAPYGAPILAAAKGKVSFVGDNAEYGLMVEVSHGFGYVTRYAHTSETLVHAGQSVERGDVIARVGDTGLAVGPHVHYEVLIHGKAVDPRRFLLNLRVVPD